MVTISVALDIPALTAQMLGASNFFKTTLANKFYICPAYRHNFQQKLL